MSMVEYFSLPWRVQAAETSAVAASKTPILLWSSNCLHTAGGSSMFAEQVPESPRHGTLLRYASRHFTFSRCFYTLLVVLLITTATVFLHYIDLWSAVPILVVEVSMMVTFLLGFIAGNVPIQRVSRLQVMHRPSTE
jgi:hypothetical protein